ncbi:8682_t:CDS:2, partial [Dentiscutata erythropus]
MALSASAWASIPEYILSLKLIVIKTSVLFSNSKDLSVLKFLNYLKDKVVFTSDSKQEIQDALKRTVERAIDSPIVQPGIKKRLKKMSDNISDTFERKEIVEFFAELDKEFEARQNQRNLEMSFDKYSSELLQKSGNLNTSRLSSYYMTTSAEFHEKGESTTDQSNYVSRKRRDVDFNEERTIKKQYQDGYTTPPPLDKNEQNADFAVEQDTDNMNYQELSSVKTSLNSAIERLVNSEGAINVEVPISKRPHEAVASKSTKNRNEESVEKHISQEDLLNSVNETSNTFKQIKFPTYYDKLKTIWDTCNAGANYFVLDLRDKKILNQVHNLLEDRELESLFERLSLEDENEHMSKTAREYMILFDQIIEESSEDDAEDVEEEGEEDSEDVEEEREEDAGNVEKEGEENVGNVVENSIKIEDEAVSEMGKIAHSLNGTAKKLRFLSNTIPIPVHDYDQSQFPDVHIIKSVSSHLDAVTKMKGIVKNTTERSWISHILAYLFFITFSFLDSVQYFSCERTISTKMDFQLTDYRADGVAEFFERPKQIPLFLLEVSGDPGDPDPDKFKTDRHKLMSEGVFALNKFMTKTELPTWNVCKTLGIFLAQAFGDELEIGQIIYIGPGLYLFSPFTIPNLIIPTSATNLEHVPRLIRTLLCLRYNIVKKIEKFKKFERSGQRRIMKPTTKYATGLSPGRLRT